MKQITVDMDMDAEVAAIVDFLNHKWSAIPDLEEIVTRLRDQALYDSRAWFNKGTFTTRMIDLAEDRLKLVEAVLDDPDEKSMVFMYDNVRSALEMIRRPVEVMAEAALSLDVDNQKKYFEDYTRPIAKKLAKEFPRYAKSKPLGWAEFAKGYQEFAGQAEYDAKPDHELYQGVDPKGYSWHLVEKLALPYLMYDDKCQGRSPTYMLVSSIYSHFLSVSEFINTQKLIAAVEGYLPFDEPGLLLGLELKAETGNAHLDILVSKAGPLPSKDELDKNLQAKREFAALSAEEQAERRAANALRMKEMMSSMFNRDPAEEMRREEMRKQELQEMKILMRSHFKAQDPSVKIARQASSDASMER